MNIFPQKTHSHPLKWGWKNNFHYWINRPWGHTVLFTQLSLYKYQQLLRGQTACTHAQINVQKKPSKDSHRCWSSPAVKRSAPAPSGSRSVSGRRQTNSCWTSQFHYSPYGGPEHVSVPAVSKRAPPVSISASTVKEEPHFIKISLCQPAVSVESLSPETKHQNTPDFVINRLFWKQRSGAVIWLRRHGKNIIRMFGVNGWMGFDFLFFCTPRCLSETSFYHGGDSEKCFRERG